MAVSITAAGGLRKHWETLKFDDPYYQTYDLFLYAIRRGVNDTGLMQLFGRRRETIQKWRAQLTIDERLGLS